ncbi:MAG TPA: serine/threonine-protein kinase [Candidatus Acidoferrum sp.]|nr:serine/threonine-protein kinase [Candidatus Acidoferrum sp.]
MTTGLKAGRYEIVGELGRGAMGVVYKATDPVIGRTVAVKTIKLSEEGTGLSRPELLTRFQTEARAAGLLTHPNIVVVFDAGEEDGLYYITMELVEGKSLQAHLDGGQAFALPRVLRIMEQTCSALQFAHERNVVHRDIKPANIMLTADDTVKVTDFGTAKILQFGTMQQTAHVMGTPSYMSPEQVKGRAVDGRSDIFSLGVLLYEMVTGEKPFPGQNITTVIYKIVNEEPVPPRQIDPSIHPGISAVVMKALAKEPETRYQSCREMLEDLRNYRSIAPGGSPDKTMVAGSPGGLGAPNATLPLGGAAIGAQGGRSFHAEDPMTVATTRSLNARASSPTQTPAVRRTGPITPLAPIEQPKKKSVIGSIFIALLLIGVIAYGVQKLRPVFEDARQINAAQKHADSDSATPANPVEGGTSITPAVSAGNETPAAGNPDAPAADKKPVEAPLEKPTPKKSDPVVSAQAAEYKGRIEEAIAEKGLTGRAKVQAIGNTLILAGKLRPAEHGSLLKFLRDAPASVRVIDHIEYEDAPVTENGHDADGGHPVPTEGRGAIHVVTDLIGATAVLRGPAGRIVNQCQTPCSFNDLGPAQYSLEVQKEGYQPMQTALQVKAGKVIDQKVALESLAKGLLLTSKPAGADVFINGAKQSGQTPVTLPLAPGSYNLVLRMPGYDAYAGSVQVKDNIQTQLDVALKEKSTVKVAWADVDTTPKGAEIFVDGQTTGQMTPARVQVPAGLHTVTVKLNGYQQVRRTFQAVEGSTVHINDVTMQPK